MSATLAGMNNEGKNQRYLLSTLALWITAAVTLLVIFWDPLFSGLFIWGPDSSSFGHIQLRNSLPASYLGWWDNLSGLGAGSLARPLLPHHLITLLMPPLTIKPGIYIGSILGAILAGVYWFRGCGMKGWPVYLASLALGLSAHTFTLISAGHDGKIQAWPFCILLLAAVNRAFAHRSLFNFALAGYAAGVAFALQPDIALLFSFLAATYGLFLFLRYWPRGSNQPLAGPEPGASQEQASAVATGFVWLRARYLGRSVLGALLAGALLFSASMSSVMFALNVVLPHRAELASATGTTENTEQSKWEFATNWSLPPDEILEFVAPCIFGIQTGDSKGSYWGSLGRSLGWEQHHQGLMNLRQHTVYLGVIQLVFALYAIVWALRRRSRGSGFRIQETVGKGQESAVGVAAKNGQAPSGASGLASVLGRVGSDLPARRADIFFWGGVFLVSVLLAFGRYFPLYRLFYMLPYAANVRAPVKLLHLAEVSLCILFAFGMEVFLAGTFAKSVIATGQERTKNKKPVASPASKNQPAADARLWRFFGIGCAIVGLLFLLGLGVVSSRQGQLLELWGSMKLANQSDLLMALLRGGLIHAAILFFVCAASFAVAAYAASPGVQRMVPFVLLLVVAVDLASVDKRYITVWDEYTRLTPREVISRLEGDKAAYRVTLPERGGIYDLWRQYIFPRNWITILDAESPGSFSPEDQAFYETLGRLPLRLWQLTSTKNILGPASSLAPLVRSPAIDVVMYFNVMRDGSVQAALAGQGQNVWLRLKTVLPRAAVYPAEYVEGNSWTNRLADLAWDPVRSAIVSGASAVPPGREGKVEPAVIDSFKPNRVEISTRSGSGGILVLNDRYDPKWEVFLDGKAAILLRCNGVMRGVAVPAGEHKVTFVYRPARVYFLASLLGVIVIVVWGAVRLWSMRRTIS